MKLLVIYGLLNCICISYAQDRKFKVTGSSRGPSEYCREEDFPPLSEAEQDADKKASEYCNGTAKRISEFEHTKKCTAHFYLKATTLATAEYECELP